MISVPILGDHVFTVAAAIQLARKRGRVILGGRTTEKGGGPVPKIPLELPGLN